MHLSIPTNWDNKLIDNIKKFPVNEVYGKLDFDILGGGKAGLILHKVSKKEAKEHIRNIHSIGAKFTYLLNAPCFGNLEYDTKTYKKIIDHIEWIRKIGTDGVTVTIPFIAEIIKTQFPELKIKVSVISHVNSVQKAKMWEDIGVDEINLDQNINRDFRLLKEIRRAVKCDICLLLNDMCLYDCPFRLYHYNIAGHASQKSNPLKGFYIEYCMGNCTNIKLSYPEEILKSRWIRPEDTHLYEKIGIEKFKISGRSQNTENLLNMIQAYSLRRYKGNLIDILEGIFRKNNTQFSMLNTIRNDKETTTNILYNLSRLINMLPFKNKIFGMNKLTNLAVRIPPKKIKLLIELYRKLTRLNENIYVDNSKLDGFIDFFKKQDCNLSCNNCNYCKKYAKKAIKINKKEINQTTVLLQRFLDELKTGTFFK